MMKMDFQTSLFIISDNRLLTEALAYSLNAQEERCLVGSAAEPGKMIERAQSCPVSIALVDTNIEKPNAVQVVREIKKELPEVKVVIIGLEQDRDDVILEFIEAGACGYILKGASFSELLYTIHAVDRKQTLCSPRLAASIVARINELSRQRNLRQAQQQTVLTSREREVLDLISKGLGNKQIAQVLNISLFTAKNHVHNILAKLQVRYRREAIRYAYESRNFERPQQSRLPVERTGH